MAIPEQETADPRDDALARHLHRTCDDVLETEMPPELVALGKLVEQLEAERQPGRKGRAGIAR